MTLIDEDSGDRKVLQFVGEPEADVRNRRISVWSPLARALIGKTKGASVEVHAPRGVKTYKILKVDWMGQHQNEQL